MRARSSRPGRTIQHQHSKMTTTPPSEWLFQVSEAPVEAVVPINGAQRRIAIHGRKALVDEQTGRILGVVSRDYQLITNARAVELAREVAARAFPDVTASEWQLGRAAGPKTRGHVHLDLLHSTHVMNLWDNPDGTSEVFTPFLRVTNSFNGARALRFDFGYMREHCSNGVVFEEKVASLTAAHTRRAIKKLEVKVATARFERVGERFANLLKGIRKIRIDKEASLEAARLLLRWPESRHSETPWRQEEVRQLNDDLARRHSAYRHELGTNAYALFNTLTDVAARPPVSRLFRRDRATIERRAGQWLKELAAKCDQPGFDFGRYLNALREEERES